MTLKILFFSEPHFLVRPAIYRLLNVAVGALSYFLPTFAASLFATTFCTAYYCLR